MFLQIVFFGLVFNIYGLMASEMGDYRLSPLRDYNLCGITRNTLRIETRKNCFQYHKEFESDLRNARPSLPREAPWMVSILHRRYNAYSWCGGTLISDKFVITAAHCLPLGSVKEHFTIYIDKKTGGGKRFKVESIHRYHDYSYNAVPIPTYWCDIAIIKMRESYKNDTQRNYNATQICLPVNGLKIPEKRYAMVAGFGVGINYTLGGSPLHIGPVIIKERNTLENFDDTPPGFTYLHRSVVDELQTCEGDSGSPIWVYDMGRAVLVGIVRGNSDDNTIVAGCGQNGIVTYVPPFLDWIFYIIAHNH